MITAFGLAVLLGVARLAFYGYKNKRSRNNDLLFKQIEINQQNRKLQDLIMEKDKLITEKDWLLTEIHHRVKNNLQIVISLLSTQSAYLKDKAAIEAICDSQHRVHAISLIHQKLYSTTYISTINQKTRVRHSLQFRRNLQFTNFYVRMPQWTCEEPR